MKLEDLFTPEELALIDSGEYRPGRAALDAKLDLCAAIEREACARVCENMTLEWKDQPNIAQAELATLMDCAAAIRARKETK